MANSQEEFRLQQTVAEYLLRQYPKVLFLSDVRAALKLTVQQAKRSQSIQKPGFSCPDMMIFEARRGMHGMFLELKKESPFKRDGSLKASEHLHNQQAAIIKLQQRGFSAAFYWEFTTIQAEIDWYLKG
jgi:hypothetical protein